MLYISHKTEDKATTKEVSKAEPLQVWKHDSGVRGAMFTRDESRVLAWSDIAVTTWDVALNNVNLTPKERIRELEVRSAAHLDSLGHLVQLKFAEWLELVRSPEYASIQKNMKAAESSRPPK